MVKRNAIKTKVLKALTKEWQTTKAIANKSNTFPQGIIGTLYELYIDDKKIERDKRNSYIYWRLIHRTNLTIRK